MGVGSGWQQVSVVDCLFVWLFWGEMKTFLGTMGFSSPVASGHETIQHSARIEVVASSWSLLSGEANGLGVRSTPQHWREWE